MKLTRFILLSAFAASFLSADKISFEFIGEPDFQGASLYEDVPPEFEFVVNHYNLINDEKVIANKVNITYENLLSGNITNELQNYLNSVGTEIEYKNKLISVGNISAIRLHNTLLEMLIWRLKFLYDESSKAKNLSEGKPINIEFGLEDFQKDENDVYEIDEAKIGKKDPSLGVAVMAFNIYRILQDFQHFGAPFDNELIAVDAYEPTIEKLIYLTNVFHGIPQYIPEIPEEPIQEEPAVEEDLVAAFSLQRSIASLLTRFKTIGGGISVGIVAVTLLYKLMPYIQTMKLFEQRSSQ